MMNISNKDLQQNNKQFYFAYGINTNMKQMAHRCPDSIHFGKAILHNHRMVFKTHADVIPDSNSFVEGVLWSLSPSCESSLDTLEGFPYYYDKKMVTVDYNGNKIGAMIYYMIIDERLGYPSYSYYDALVEGYTDNQLNTEQLETALTEIKELV